MKVTDLRRKLLAALSAAGMLAPGAAYAANLNQNLVVNGDFETVDLATVGDYNSPRILNWNGTSAFAYSHDGSSSNFGVVPNYADGTPPPNAGHWYFTSNNAVPDINAPGQFYQDVDVSTGATSDAIATGLATFNLSAYMSSYLDDTDVGHVHLDFRNGVGTSLGTAVVNDSDPGPSNVWNLNTGTGAVPAGTATVRVSLYGTRTSGGPGPDGYIDNVDFQVSSQAPVLAILVNRTTGNITLKNLTNSSVPISGYSITSAFEGMTPTNWLSIADNYDSGNPGPNQVDPSHAWSKLTGAGTHTDLSEADLQAGVGASLANGASLNLGNSTWLQTPHEDLVFQYVSNGQVVDGIVAYTGNNSLPFANGDLNLDGAINSADWAILRTNQLGNLSSQSLAQAYRLGDLNADKLSNHADFIAFKTLYDAANGAGAFVAMVSASAVPEPASALLVLAAGVFILPALRRRGGC
jgi:hypothetical protein